MVKNKDMRQICNNMLEKSFCYIMLWLMRENFILKLIHLTSEVDYIWAATWENGFFAYAKSKEQISCASSDLRLCLVQSLYFETPILMLYSAVCVKPGQKPWRQPWPAPLFLHMQKAGFVYHFRYQTRGPMVLWNAHLIFGPSTKWNLVQNGPIISEKSQF